MENSLPETCWTKIHSPAHENPLLSTEEKRRWLARVFRDEDGEYSQADKFKALVEDTKLAALQQEEEEFKRQREMGAEPQDPILALLQSLPRQNSISIITPLPDNLTG